MTPTPPDNFARRSCNFSRSNSEVVSADCARMTATRCSMASFSPAPSTMVVESLVTTTLPARPKCSTVVSFNSKPKSSAITVPPVRIAMSCSISLRRSPKPGALTAATLNVPRNLFNTNVGNASPSTSSATINNGRPCCRICSNKGKMSWILDNLRSVIRI